MNTAEQNTDHLFQQAVELHRTGQLDKAEEYYRQLIDIIPEHPDGNYNLGLVFMQKAQPSLAEGRFLAAVNADPSCGEYWVSYIDALLQTGQTETAQDALAFARQNGLDGPAVDELSQRLQSQRPATLNTADTASLPDHQSGSSSPPEVEQLLALFGLGRLEEIIPRASNLTSQHPEYPIGWKILGIALEQLGRSKEAIPALQRAITLAPQDADAHSILGMAQQHLGNLDEAIASYRQAIRLAPNNVQIHCNLGSALQAINNRDEAEACYRRAITLKPGYAKAHANLGSLLLERRCLPEAASSFRHALTGIPEDAEALLGLGISLYMQHKLPDAEIQFRKLKARNPDSITPDLYLGQIFQHQGKYSEAEAIFRHALQLEPDNIDTLVQLFALQYNMGEIDQSLASVEHVLRLDPNHAIAAGYRLFIVAYLALLSPSEYLREARRWENIALTDNEREAAHQQRFIRPPAEGRRLRIGYISGDYRQHAVSHFIERIFASHNRERIELFAYSTHFHRDSISDRLEALVEHWIPSAALSNDELHSHIANDQIDILIDLSGYTPHNRLEVFAKRAAPVQAHYLGYFASTGLTEMDYWIGDTILTPPATDAHFSEQVWRLPRTWVCYDAQDNAPIPDWHPDPAGTIWLGSFNNPNKLTPETLALWARILLALPEAKLLLKAGQLSIPGFRKRIMETMQSYGIIPERIELQGSQITPDWPNHMAYYNRLDIALDPIGAMGGGTTTCDALWMGVPVITLAGNRMTSRMSASMLDAVSHPEWIAESEEDYIDKVVSLARDVGLRSALRPAQRDRMASSPLCDAHGMAVALEEAYVAMFERWRENRTLTRPESQAK